MVKEIELEYINMLINDCINKTGYEASKAFCYLNHHIGILRKDYQEGNKNVSH